MRHFLRSKTTKAQKLKILRWKYWGATPEQMSKSFLRMHK